MPGDVVDAVTRSRMMAGIKGKDTKPEMIVRRGLHALGFRFLLHDKRLPGRPDMVLPRWRAVVFVHGCFWHGHDCPLFRWPGTRRQFWREKIEGNKRRDAVVEASLDHTDWRVLNIWECSMKGPGRIGADVVLTSAADWLRSDQRKGEIRGAGRASG